MRNAKKRHRYYQRKLSHLVEEELGYKIQQNSIDSIGHSSVEDATAALLLYWKRRFEWERSLGYPLTCLSAEGGGGELGFERKFEAVKFYLDGCNLPLGMRRAYNPKVDSDEKSKVQSTSACCWRLISKTSTQGTAQVNMEVDWIPILKSALLQNARPSLERVVIMFDGAKFRSCREDKRPPKFQQLYDSSSGGGIFVLVSDVDTEVDDVLVDQCKKDLTVGSSHESSGFIIKEEGCHFDGRIVSIDEVIDILSCGYNGDGSINSDTLDSYIVVRRKAGGTKTNKKLFDKLHLRRPQEGALCLTGLTERLLKNSLVIAKELQRARVHDLVEYEVRRRDLVRSIVVTNDVLLADRVAKEGGIVLSFRQMQQMFQ